MGYLYSWMEKLAKPCNLEDVCNQKKFITKARRLKERGEKMRNKTAKQADKESLLDDIFQFNNILEQGAIPVQERLNVTKNTLKRKSNELREVTNTFVQVSKEAESLKHSNNAMRHDFEALLNTNDRLELENANMKEENRTLKEIISNKDILIEEQRRQIDSAEVEITRLTLEKITKERKAAGLQKAKIFWEEKAKEPIETESSKSKPKGTQTNLQGINTEIIQVVSETSDSFIKEGKVYSDISSDMSSRISDGKCYVSKLPIRRVPTRDAVRSEKVKRAHQAFTLIKHVAAKEGDFVEETDVVPLITTWFRQHPRLMQQAADAAGIHFMQKLSAEQTADLRTCGRFSNSKMRMVRTFFNNTVSNMSASERQVRRIGKERVGPLLEEKMEIGTMVLKEVNDSENRLKKLPYAKVIDLRKFIEEILDTAERECKISHDETLDGKYYLLFQADRGSTTTKFYMIIINEVLIQGLMVDCVHVYCAFEGSDCLENMWKIYGSYVSQLKELSKESCRVNGRKVELFLGGDFKNIDLHLGKQGSTPTYPDESDLVTLRHLQ